MQLTIDHQVVKQTCEHCKADFRVSRGSVFSEGHPIGIYLASMHACYEGRLVYLAIALREDASGQRVPNAVTLNIRPTETDILMSVVDRTESPWQHESYLGHMMSRNEALSSELITKYFDIADYIVTVNPEVGNYLEDEPQ